ncbi:hypothetical protein [Streptomyces boncukensis]|uniref:Uncharacterized protein n=1 Tax=Streptomyces boncukensis TaxID=2711219 RepID=A0A6G4WTC9_9ACTN|nr:hypothetical protein [Streptomyces boncukensis]NGO68539.1 hypothetical protein [Streptomyces boncukensis]
MPYRYTCRTCRASGAVHTTRRGAHRDETGHRTAVHDGMTPPDGDHVHYATPSPRGLIVTAAVLLLLVAIKAVTGVAPDDVARWAGLL